jgi:hypothetical protein
LRICLRYIHAATLSFVLSTGIVATALGVASPFGVLAAEEPTIMWGGEHVEMELTKDGGKLDFDCATGTITEPPAVDAQGKFRVSGTYLRERPGPTMRDGNLAVAAVYSGSISGTIMHLHIVSGPDKEVVGDYLLVRGQPGHVMKCR